MRKNIGRFRKLLLLSVLLFLYFVLLLRSLNEGSRRSLQLRDDTDVADHIVISALVTAVGPATQELTAQISLRPQGTLAQDEVTPAVDLKLLTNNVRSQQQFDFPKGKRMNRIEAVFPLNGELNKYPFDRYATTLWFLVITPARKKQPQTSNTPGSSLNFTGIELKMRRADNVISVSILLMILMIGLAMSLLAMVFKATTSGPKVDLVPLSLSISLIFGLPALRNVQPGVPPVGAFGDYVSFIWAEIIVGVSTIIIIWTWLLRLPEEP
jgi:Domain of unknown function (DUF4436)